MLLRFRRLCTIAGLASTLTLSMTGIANADPGRGCTVGGEPPGAFISFFARAGAHSGEFNPGNGHNPVGNPPFVPTHFNSDCNPTDNPSPPNPQA